MTENWAVVIVINGPIASGKSSVARALAQEFERRGLSAACIDLDLLYEMLEHSPRRKDDDSKWNLARRAAAALTDGFLAGEIAVVIVDGGFWIDERRAYLRHLHTPVEPPRFVTLRVSIDVALRRVQSDDARTFSKDPRFLRQHYAAMQAAFRRLPSTDLLIDTESRTATEVAREIADSLRE